MKFLLIPLTVILLLFFLYDRGFISVKMGRALIFVGTIFSARYKGFHGTIRRVLRPAESKSYLFSFSSELSCGSIEAEIFDKENNLLLHLQRHEKKELYLEQGNKYILVLRARSADGAHHLEWN